MRDRRVFQIMAAALVCMLLVGWGQARPVSGEVAILASPIQAGCYQVHHDLCKIHIEPFTVNLAASSKLVYFQVLAQRQGAFTGSVIWDFRSDVSYSLPVSGSVVNPSLPKKDFAAACGQTYTISLQGQDTSSASTYILGMTNPISCPVGTYYTDLPVIRK